MPKDKTQTHSADVLRFLTQANLRFGYKVSFVASSIIGPGYDEVQRETGLIRGEYLLLVCLAHEPVLTAQDVARMTGRPRNTISRAVHRMLKEGFIDRAPDQQDKRQAKLTITEKGRKMQSRIEAMLAMHEERVFGVLDPDEKAQLDGILTKLVRHAAALDR